MAEKLSTTEIVVCMGSSCFSRGNSANLSAIREFVQSHSMDAIVRLSGSRCEEQCMHGPVIGIDGELFHGVTPESVLQLLSERLLYKE